MIQIIFTLVFGPLALWLVGYSTMKLVDEIRQNEANWLK